MAKQKGLHKLAGKVDEQSYYYSKNGGYQSRKINPGIGERVKSAPEYANTRLNNAEFGVAGSFAGALVREVSLRWRYILDSIATGKLVKIIKALISQDSTHPWGQRSVDVSNLPAIQEAYSRFSKNQIPEVIANYISTNVSYNSGSSQIAFADDVAIGTELSNFLNSIGATGVKLSFYVLSATNPQYSALTRKYLPVDATLVKFAEESVASIAATTTLIAQGTYNEAITPSNSPTFISGVLVVFEPVRTIGSTDFVLQQHCSALWKSL